MTTKKGETMGKHTAGPWGYEVGFTRGDIEGQRPPITIYSDHGEIADININQAIGDDERQANASLIASAPELKLELKDLTEAVKSCAENGTITGNGVDYLLRIISNYKSIAKAEGK